MAEEDASLEETKRLGKDLLSSRAHVNNAPLLLSILSSSNNAAITPSSVRPLSSSSPLSSTAAQCRLEALHSLHAFLVPLLRTGNFFAAARRKAKRDLEAVAAAAGGDDGDGDPNAAKAAKAGKAEAVYRLWVWNKYREFKKSLFRIAALSTNPQVLQIAAVNTLMDLVREERVGEFNNSLYLKICARMVGYKGERNEILQVLGSKYFKYNDVRYYTYANIEKLVTKRLGTKRKEDELVSSDDDKSQESFGASLHTFVRNIYDVLSHLPLPLKDDQKDGADELWSNSRDGEESGKATGGTKQGRKTLMQKDTKKEKQILTRAWIAFLQLSLPLDVYKKVLARLHRNVVPYMTNPLLLSDFLTQSYNTGGLISVMALGSLFILITKYGLEYPDFYNKLYALLEPSIFVARYRSRFFELLDTCLKSSHLPGYMGAAFAKRLGRLVLSAPPSGAIVVIALIHNLLRRHPSINVLVHRLEGKAASAVVPQGDSGNDNGEAVSSFEGEQETQDIATEGKLGADPFVALEPDVAKCNALKSSLWEIESLRRHYCPAVSRFVNSLENDLTVRAKTTEVTIPDFSATSYATIFEEEVGRRMKSVPMAFYSTVPNTLFPDPESNFDSSFDGWRFDESAGLNSELLKDIDGNATNDIMKELGKVSARIEDAQGADSMEDDDSEEMSSDGSGGSRSRSEQSDGEDWPQPLLKRLRGP